MEVAAAAAGRQAAAVVGPAAEVLPVKQVRVALQHWMEAAAVPAAMQKQALSRGRDLAEHCHC